jgi:GNAT superfamily N-acetyltransferase
MKIIELNEEDYATLSGYSVSSNQENYKNFLIDNISNEMLANKIVEFIKNKDFNDIVIIKNLNVDEEYRGQGIGRNLLEEAISEAEIAILISDKYEIQNKGFVLDKFYINSDFEPVLDTSSGSLMIYPSEIALEIKDMLNLKKKNKSQFKI